MLAVVSPYPARANFGWSSCIAISIGIRVATQGSSASPAFSIRKRLHAFRKVKIGSHLAGLLTGNVAVRVGRGQVRAVELLAQAVFDRQLDRILEIVVGIEQAVEPPGGKAEVPHRSGPV